MSMRGQDNSRGFFSSLFDFSFTSNVTPQLIKVIYGFVMVFAGLAALGLVAISFRADVGLGIVVLLVIAPLLFLFYVIVYRVMLEVVMSVFRIADNTARLADAVPDRARSTVPPSLFPTAPNPQWGEPDPTAPRHQY